MPEQTCLNCEEYRNPPAASIHGGCVWAGDLPKAFTYPIIAGMVHPDHPHTNCPTWKAKGGDA